VLENLPLEKKMVPWINTQIQSPVKNMNHAMKKVKHGMVNLVLSQQVTKSAELIPADFIFPH